MTRPTQLDKRKEMLKEMFAEIGEGCYMNHLSMQIWQGLMSILEKMSMPTLTNVARILPPLQVVR